MDAARVLVVDGNVAEARGKQTTALGYDAGIGYARVLRQLVPGLVCDIIYPADANALPPAGASLESYDGVAITGSALNISQGGAPVTRQVEFAKAVFDAGVPMFGSCWGLQVAVTAAGGVVRVNPRGREFGFARRVLLSSAGRDHPLYADKPDVFEAPTVHRDDIESLPTDAVELASNEMGLQAAVFSYRRGTFWGVQYHPEYGYLDVAAVAGRYRGALIEAGVFSDPAALDTFVADLHALHADPHQRTLLWKYGLGPAMLDERVRLAELRNWLVAQVLPRHSRIR
jgi:GMP synthase (glutamine-hydrolysing)